MRLNEGFLTLYERERAVSTGEYLASITALPAHIPQSTSWKALWAFGSDMAVISVPVTGQSPWVDPVEEMRTTITQLEARVAALEEEVHILRASVGEEVAVLRTVDREKAMREVRELYAQGDVYYISEVAERLSLPDDQVVSIIQELESKGEIEQHERL